MKKNLPVIGTTTFILAAVAGCLLLNSCNGESIPRFENPAVPTGWLDKHPVLDLTRSFSFATPLTMKVAATLIG